MPFGAPDIAGAFGACGIGAGAIVMLHSDAIVAAQLPPMPAELRLDVVLETIEEVLGPSGTLVLPTFTYSFTRNEDFDPQSSPSEMGLLAERFRHYPRARRSRQPLFSVAAGGALRDDFAAVPVDDCFGPDSAFGLLLRHDGWIACLGCGFDRVTFVHYVEQSVPVKYRYFKLFEGNIAGIGEVECRYFVRDLGRDTATDLTRLKQRLIEKGLLREAPVGRFGLLAVRARDFFDTARALLAEDPAALIREGAAA